MKAIASSSSSLLNSFLDRNGDRDRDKGGSFYLREFSSIRSVKNGFFPSNKLLICFGQKGLLHPVSAESHQADFVTVVEIPNKETDQSKTVHVKLLLKRECSFGEQFALVGNDPIFGMWDPDSAIPLNWSDGHVWTLDLDIPIGKSIHFKFILKQITGNVLWQPGPDRILKTWETNNTIVVLEDWEDDTLQKLLEEEPITSQNEDSPSNTQMLDVADILTEENGDDSNAENESSSTYEEETSNNPSEQIPIVADNIGCSNEDMDTDVSESYELQFGHENETIGDNGRVPIDMNNTEEPVLVPGLYPLNLVSSLHENEASREFEASIGADQVENHNLTELDDEWEIDRNPQGTEMSEVRANNVELDDKSEITDDSHEAEATHETIKFYERRETTEDVYYSNGKEREAEVEQNAAVQQQQHENGVLQNDLKWGRKTIQKLLLNLGFM